jgi:hypothetical protein
MAIGPSRPGALIRNLSTPGEVLLVTSICFGWPIVKAIAAIQSQWAHPRPSEIDFGSAIMVRSALLEILSLGATLWIGIVRSWPFAKFGLQVSWKRTLAGGLLFAVALTSSILKYSIIAVFVQPAAAIRFAGPTLPIALLGSIVNAFFEEAIESAYYLWALRSLGMWTAVLASALFVGFLHAYQGLSGAVGVVLIRVIFGLAYWRWKQLWPLFFAHSLLDILALTTL